MRGLTECQHFEQGGPKIEVLTCQSYFWVEKILKQLQSYPRTPLGLPTWSFKKAVIVKLSLWLTHVAKINSYLHFKFKSISSNSIQLTFPLIHSDRENKQIQLPHKKVVKQIKVLSFQKPNIQDWLYLSGNGTLKGSPLP